MWWNSYRNPGQGEPLTEAIAPLLSGIVMPPSEGASGHYSLDRGLHEGTLAAAGFKDIQFQLFRRERVVNAEEVVALYRSYSFVRLLSEDRRNRLLEAIVEIVNGEFAGRAPNVILTAGYSAQRG